MKNVIKVKATNGNDVEFVNVIIGAGRMKDVYFSPDKSYVVAFFRDSLDWMVNSRPKYTQTKDRLETITNAYFKRLFEQEGGEYWKNLYCWPTDVVEVEKKGIGIVAPAYQKQYFFEFGSKNNDFLYIAGKEKEGKWFASAKNRHRFIDDRELGDWLSYLRIGIMLSRAVARLHAAGLAHSDLSYKNCLINPIKGNACIIDIDGLVVPQKFPPDVVGTPDFIAPEVVMTSHLPITDKNRMLPSILTDRHALAVLIYMYLLYRHPLRGDKVHDTDPVKDDNLSMGAKALFVEHPSDKSNRVKLADASKWDLPWADCDKMPVSITGPYLTPLFKRAFIDGLHKPNLRPTAAEWETALVKTVDLIQPCNNKDCQQKWYVFDNTVAPRCPFCGASYIGLLPVLNLYSNRAGSYRLDNHRLMVYKDQSLFQWHVNRNVFPNEKLTDEQKKRVGYFTFHQGAWWLVNERLPRLINVSAKNNPIPLGGKIELTDGLKLLLSDEEGGRLVVVQMVKGS
jgi:serine/threonine protein kinase